RSAKSCVGGRINGSAGKVSGSLLRLVMVNRPGASGSVSRSSYAQCRGRTSCAFRTASSFKIFSPFCQVARRRTCLLTDRFICSGSGIQTYVITTSRVGGRYEPRTRAAVSEHRERKRKIHSSVWSCYASHGAGPACFRYSIHQGQVENGRARGRTPFGTG